MDTAVRELEEETGLVVRRILADTPITEHYTFQRNGAVVNKTVTYFLVEVDGNVSLQEEEIADGRWLSLAEAEGQMTFAEGKKLCQQLQQRL